MERLNFFDIPPDILEATLLLLALPSLLTLRATNRFLNEFIHSSIRLRYHYHLECFGLEEQHGDRAISIQERMTALIERERRWLNLLPCQSVKLDVTGQTSLYITDRVMLAIFNTTNSDPRKTFASAETMPGPETKSVVAQPKWRPSGSARNLREVHACEANDLLVVLEYDAVAPNSEIYAADLRFLQLSTGLPHPHASQPTMRLVEYDLSNIADHSLPAMLQSAGSNLAIILDTTDHETEDLFLLYMVDWRRGAHLTVPFACSTSALAFLSPDTFVLANAVDLSLDVFRIPPWEIDLVELERFASLSLPPMPRNTRDLSTLGSVFRCSSTMSWDDPQNSARSASFPQPRFHFSPKKQHTVFLFIYLIASAHPSLADTRINFVVRSHDLLALLGLPTSNQSSHRSYTPEDWVPRCARWLAPVPWPDANDNLFLMSSNASVANSGARIIGFREREGRGAISHPRQVVVLDTNPWTVEIVRRAAAAAAATTDYDNADGDNVPIWKQLGILPGVAADGTLRTESGAVLRLMSSQSGSSAGSYASAGTLPHAWASNLAYVEITSATTHDYLILRINNESIVGYSGGDPDHSSELLFFG
ncbi:F-box domain-containing protein [Mycena indigotica]|uniref:F-box domain-containing protein n=1 Tax=Mycena indigotica TaxID=2126181 RepID=A0A8H6VPI4_9AGAR|nr:F-box domain-containing protein [Mycena indigotica]KAF7288884.1 F-box domain-containing protein [Mycena indigotica]